MYGIRVGLAGAVATAASGWYVLPFFSTTIVLSMLLLGEDETPGHCFVERIVLTLVGVGLAA
ncbi:hypothetical protein [Agromyces salentinus]|uniref:Uncharacterized protein n=1 Tax=Agromyces salentinus TaxID=269421 RepID=A0ABN2MRV7_9MICO|nr:hypothetical protein [Agromyces salentinus]